MTKRPNKVTPDFARGYSAGFTAAATADDAHRLGGLIERAIRDLKRESGTTLVPDGWTIVNKALSYPPETPTEPSQSIPRG